MNSTRRFRLVGGLLLTLVAAGLSAQLNGAQICRVKFTLPFEAQWGKAVLPPGDYSLNLMSSAGPISVTREDGEFVTYVLGQGTSEAPGRSGEGYLVIVRRGAMRAIRELHLPDMGLAVYFRVPKAEKTMIANEPYLLQRIPVSGAGR